MGSQAPKSGREGLFCREGSTGYKDRGVGKQAEGTAGQRIWMFPRASFPRSHACAALLAAPLIWGAILSRTVGPSGKAWLGNRGAPRRSSPSHTDSSLPGPGASHGPGREAQGFEAPALGGEDSDESPPRWEMRAPFGLAQRPSTAWVPCLMEKIGSAAVGIGTNEAVR